MKGLDSGKVWTVERFGQWKVLMECERLGMMKDKK